MKRIMVNLDDSVGELVERKAQEQKRSTSSYVALLVESDLRAAGLLDAPTSTALTEFMAKVEAAAAARPLLVARLEAALRRELRPSKARCLKPAA